MNDARALIAVTDSPFPSLDPAKAALARLDPEYRMANSTIAEESWPWRAMPTPSSSPTPSCPASCCASSDAARRSAVSASAASGSPGPLLILGLALIHAAVFYPAEIVDAAAGFVYGFFPALALVMTGWLLSGFLCYAVGLLGGAAVARPLARLRAASSAPRR